MIIFNQSEKCKQMTPTADGWMGGWTDRQMDGRMDGRTEILPCVLQDIVPFGSAALLHIHIINKILAGQGYR